MQTYMDPTTSGGASAGAPAAVPGAAPGMRRPRPMRPPHQQQPAGLPVVGGPSAPPIDGPPMPPPLDAATGQPVPAPAAPQPWQPPPPPDSRGGTAYTQPTAPAAPTYATMQTFGPGQDLRGTQITPGQSAGTQAVAGQAAGARGAYAGAQTTPFQSVGGGSYAPGADTSGTRAMLSQALQSLANGPDRGQLAAQNFALLDQTAAEGSARDQRTIGQSAAKFGRIGSGITTTNLGDLGERQALARSRAQSQMSLDAAGQTMGDRLGIAGAVGSGFGALSGADRADAGVNQSLRNELRGERDAGVNYGQQQFQNAGQRAGDFSAYEQAANGQDASNRTELRGERGYQGDLENQAYGRTVGERTLSDYLTNSGFGRAMSLLNAGYGNNPAGTIANAGAQAQGNATNGYGDLMQWLSQYLKPGGG